MKRLALIISGVLLVGALSMGIYQQTANAAIPGGIGGLIGGAGPSGAAPVTTCAYEDLGWIICPVLTATAKAGDFAFSFMTQSFSQIEIGLVNNTSGARQAGAMIRNIANILFALAFLFIVYSLISGRGLDNYNLKRLVPRFIVAVVFVQMSYFICQIMIDISNILGVTIQKILVEGVADQIGVSAMPIPKEIGTVDVASLADVTSGVVSNIDIAWPLLAPLASVILAAAVICAVLIIVLIIRKVLVVALMMISPLAFVAYLLPNTSEYFSKWLKLFVCTLLLFPVISLLIGTGQIVSASILAAGSSDYQVQDDKIIIAGKPNQSATLHLVAAGAAVLPLIGTWYVFQATISGLQTAGARLSRGNLQRSSRERDEKAKRREQTTMDMNKKSMMMRGINRIQQLSSAQEGTNGGSVFGRQHRGRGKHTQKSPEQLKFDSQVQARLGEIREKANRTGMSPHEIYSQALQRYQEKTTGGAEGGMGSEAGLNINSFEGIDLKASEAYLLESLGRVSTALSTQTVRNNKSTPASPSAVANDAAATATPPAEPNSPTVTPGVRSATPDGAPSLGDEKAALTNAATPTVAGGGQTIVVAPGAEASEAAANNTMANGTGYAAHRETQNTNEQDAKVRAAKYMSDALGGATIAEAEELLNNKTQPPASDDDKNNDNLLQL